MNAAEGCIRYIIKQICSVFIGVDKNKIVILDETPFSGSNSYAFYNYLTKVKKYKNVEITGNIDIKDRAGWRGKLDAIGQYIKKLKTILSAKIVISDHSMMKSSRGQIIIQFWHGIPLKGMGLMDKSDDVGNYRDSMKDINLFTVTSVFSEVLLNACMGMDVNRYKALGNPRNDLLYAGKKDVLKKLINEDISHKKFIVYMPTYKKGHIDRQEGAGKDKNIFAFESFDMQEFDKYLKDNDTILLVKLHPMEEKYYKQKLESINSKNIVILETDYLIKEKTDIYEFLAASDMLITDYSSVYLDYLLTLKPVIFNNCDIETYRQVRGILLEPYDIWTPGPKVKNQQSLQEEITKSLNNENYYLEERKNLLNIFHDHKDNKSCERIWNFISEKYL